MKPVKPFEGFPLYAHSNGSWAKKIRGRVRYFGPWNDPDGALKKFQAQRDALMAGMEPQQEGVTLKHLVNCFLTSKEDDVDSGDLSTRTFRDYKEACQRFTKHISKYRTVESLTPQDFAKVRKKLAKTRGPVSILNDISRVRTMFKWGVDQEIIDQPPRYGQKWKKPSQTKLRQARAEKGSMMFEPEEIIALLDAANPKLRAMILLGCNCAFGPSDCARLKWSMVQKGWINFPRPKTGIARRVPLWPETLDALPAPSSGLVFLTAKGNRFDPDNDRPLSKELTKLSKSLGIHHHGRSFYGFRRATQTIGEEVDAIATSAIMGHAPKQSDMSAVYRQYLFDRRLLNVVSHVREWVFEPVITSILRCLGTPESIETPSDFPWGS